MEIDANLVEVGNFRNTEMAFYGDVKKTSEDACVQQE